MTDEYKSLGQRMEEDGSHFQGNTRITPQCNGCVFYDRVRGACPAFPDGIPLSIQMNRYDHRRLYPLQKGMARWTPVRSTLRHPLEGQDLEP